MTELARLAQRSQAFPRDQFAETRLQGWILQLELAQIPEALAVISEMDRKKGFDRVSEEMIMVLARWYELEGEGVFAWIRAQEGWEKGRFSKAEVVLIVDGFHRDPQRGLELALELINRRKNDDEFSPNLSYASDFLKKVLYEVGAWGLDPIMMLGRLDPKGELREGYQSRDGLPYLKEEGATFPNGLGRGFPVTRHSPSSYGSNEEIRALANGLLDSGREEIARQLMADLADGVNAGPIPVRSPG